MITFKHTGDFSKLTRYLEKAKSINHASILDKYGKAGVSALRSATPIESGQTANSWGYEVANSKGSATITFYNTHENKGVPIAIILQYGHGTGTGGYVQGRYYINPGIQPIFDELANEAWREVTKL